MRAERDRAHRADEAGRRRDGHQADDDARSRRRPRSPCRCASMSSSVQTTSVAGGASIVVVKASAADGLAASALPALKPNQPNHSRPAPSSVNGTLCGSSADDGSPCAGRRRSRRPAPRRRRSRARRCRRRSRARPSWPASRRPTPSARPGVDDERPQRDERRRRREKRMRSTMAPEISAAVMIANVPW